MSDKKSYHRVVLYLSTGQLNFITNDSKLWKGQDEYRMERDLPVIRGRLVKRAVTRYIDLRRGKII